MRSVAPALRIKRYVQSHTLTSPVNEALRRGRGGPEPYDGVAELSAASPQRRAARLVTVPMAP